ncbi:hypothetical protein DEO23_06515 [Brachybacterium endophyticum]|uniref:Metallopeptidase family protein n=1 Tax=Brachybacterium endophyticum TaxID=2182385 RepID=A0A2U2RL47_9MICO|nr:metallopeptidase family protein [Brachybacterium endophyticum]PWH06599.1 hypothetical protein DEO23_06515 [Brachybacterium endophyticum]
MISISHEDFEEAVDDALDSLPEETARLIAESNVVILIEEEPDPVRDGRQSSELLGIYHGIPLDQRSTFDSYIEPDRILIFRGPMQRVCASRDQLGAEIRVTVLHELGHMFGLSESRLHELGWG